MAISCVMGGHGMYFCDDGVEIGGVASGGVGGDVW